MGFRHIRTKTRNLVLRPALCRALGARHGGFTLVELLVVIAIIGILVALLLPAVQAAREAARRNQCKNNIKNIALGCLLHEDAHGFLPSGGWGLDWTADPNRGYGADQPGSWQYNILAFVEEAALRDLGSGQAITSPAFRQASETLHSTSLALFHCPTRRASRPYPSAWSAINLQNWLARVARSKGVAKSDYAANSGDSTEWSGDAFPRPTDYAGASTIEWFPTDVCDLQSSRTSRRYITFCQTGVMYIRSELRFAQITDGTSNTYLVGEKYLQPEAYDGATDPGAGFTYGDNQSLYVGYEWDNHRVAFGERAKFSDAETYQPRQDRSGYDNYAAFGSAHAGGMNMAMCDGSVQSVAYDIDALTHRRLANRFDGAVVTLDQ